MLMHSHRGTYKPQQAFAARNQSTNHPRQRVCNGTCLEVNKDNHTLKTRDKHALWSGEAAETVRGQISSGNAKMD